MTVNSWFPKLRADGVIASGNAGIWVTPLTGPPVQVSPVGTSPVWAGQTLVYNRNDNTTQVGRDVLATAYNDYVGSDGGQWAGFSTLGAGQIDRYTIRNGFYTHGPVALPPVPRPATAPRFLGLSFGYLSPYLTAERTLFIDGLAQAHGLITTWVADRTGQAYCYARATGTYTKQIVDQEGNDCTIRTQQDETPLAIFIAPDGLPWILSVAEPGTFVRYIYSASGYVIAGDLYNPDCRVLGDRLRVVGSSSAGVLRSEWIDFGAPMVDLRKA